MARRRQKPQPPALYDLSEADLVARLAAAGWERWKDPLTGSDWWEAPDTALYRHATALEHARTLPAREKGGGDGQVP